MIYVFTENDLEWKFVVTAEDLKTAVKVLSQELKSKGYKLQIQKDDDWRTPVYKSKKQVGTLGIAESPLEMNQVY